jgi:hypothetical protein
MGVEELNAERVAGAISDPIPTPAAGPSAAPLASLANGLGNQAFGSVIAQGTGMVAARTPRRGTQIARQAPAEAPPLAQASGPAEEEPQLPMEDRAILSTSVVAPLRAVAANLDPKGSKQKLALPLRHLKPVLATLPLLRPRPGTDAYGAIMVATSTLPSVETQLSTIVEGKKTATVVQHWTKARTQAKRRLDAVTEASKKAGGFPPQEDARQIQLIHGSVLPSIDNAIRDVKSPGADLKQVFQASLPTYAVITAPGGEELYAAAETFRTGLDVLDALSSSQEEIVTRCKGIVDFHVTLLDNIAAGKPMLPEAPPEPPTDAPAPGPGAPPDTPPDGGPSAPAPATPPDQPPPSRSQQ